MNRAHTQFAPPQAHSDIDLPLFDLAISEPEEQMTRRSALEQADTGADAVAAPSASTRHHSSSIFPSLPPAAASALSSSHPTGACCAHASRSEQQQQSASRSDEDAESDSDSDPYGTRIPLSRLVDLVFASPAELIERAELEMEMLHQIQASPASKARLYSEAATIPALMQKNRYSNIIPTRAARVILPSSSHSSVDSPSRYINACLLPPLLPGCAQPYIAAQAPLPHTVPEFWHMIWAQRSGLVVMLTSLRERDSSGRVAHKAHPYWPEQSPAAAAAAASSAAAAAAVASSGEGQLQATVSSDSDSLPSTRYGPFTVTLLSTRREPDFIVRELLLSRDEGEGQGQGDGPDSTPRRVHQIQYTGWPDFGVPDDQDEAGGFLRIFSLYRALRTHLHNEHAALSAAATAAAESRRGEGQAEPAEAAAAAAAAAATAAASPSGSSPSPSSSSSVPPVVVHCSAGIGRSGVWIAIDALLDALSGSQPPRSIDLFALVCRMREARQGMLQTKEQYAYVLHFLATCMHKRRFGVANHGN